MVGIGTPTLGTAPRKKKPEEEGVGKIPQPVTTPAPGGLGAPAPAPPPTAPHPDANTARIGATPPAMQGGVPGAITGASQRDGTQQARVGGTAPGEGNSTIDDGMTKEEGIEKYLEDAKKLAQETAANAPPGIDEEIEALVRRLLSGQADTTQEEALIQELMGQQIGKDAVGNRASMGRAGFASSGALGAMQADSERAARQQALDDILGLRRDASQTAIDNAIAAGQLDIGMRDAATREQEAASRAAALKALLEGGEAPPADANGDGIPDNPKEAAQGVVGGVQDAASGTDAALDWAQKELGIPENRTHFVDKPPDGAQELPAIVAGGVAYRVYVTFDGNVYFVEK